MKNFNSKALKLLSLLVLLFIAYPANAQYSVNITDKTIAQAIKIIEGSTDYKFFYAENLPDLTKRVSFKTVNKPIEAALENLFRGTRISYKISGQKQIVLSQKGAQASVNTPALTPSAGTYTVKGTVKGLSLIHI